MGSRPPPYHKLCTAEPRLRRGKIISLLLVFGCATQVPGTQQAPLEDTCLLDPGTLILALLL